MTTNFAELSVWHRASSRARTPAAWRIRQGRRPGVRLLRTPKSRRSIGATCCRLVHRGNRSGAAIEGRSGHRAAQRSRLHKWLHAASRLHRIYLGNAMPTKSRGPPLTRFRTPRRSTVDVMSVKGALTTASARSRDDQRTDADSLQVLLGQALQDPFFISFRRTAARQRRRRQIPAAQNITSRFMGRAPFRPRALRDAAIYA